MTYGNFIGYSEILNFNPQTEYFHKKFGGWCQKLSLNKIGVIDISYVMENNQINPWVTTTGAISATALAFLATNDHEIASWFQIPNSVKLIEQIKPNDITLRVIAR